jgi:hypothetical protein
LSKSLKDIWEGVIQKNTLVYQNSWSMYSNPNDPRFVKLEAVNVLYGWAKWADTEVRKLRKLLVENGAAYYNSDGVFTLKGEVVNKEG